RLRASAGALPLSCALLRTLASFGRALGRLLLAALRARPASSAPLPGRSRTTWRRRHRRPPRSPRRRLRRSSAASCLGRCAPPRFGLRAAAAPSSLAGAPDARLRPLLFRFLRVGWLRVGRLLLGGAALRCDGLPLPPSGGALRPRERRALRLHGPRVLRGPWLLSQLLLPRSGLPQGSSAL